MRLPKGAVILVAISFVLGFIVGDVYGGYVAQFVSVIIFLGGGAAGLVLFVMGEIRDYLSTPKLEFGGLFFSPKQRKYLLRVRKTNGDEALSCRGIVAILGTRRADAPSVWDYPDMPRETNIATYSDLVLFMASSRTGSATLDEISVFLGTTTHWDNDGFNTSEVTDKILRVTLVANKGRVPKPYEKKISEIISEAKEKIA